VREMAKILRDRSSAEKKEKERREVRRALTTPRKEKEKKREGWPSQLDLKNAEGTVQRDWRGEGGVAYFSEGKGKVATFQEKKPQNDDDEHRQKEAAI